MDRQVQWGVKYQISYSQTHSTLGLCNSGLLVMYMTEINTHPNYSWQCLCKFVNMLPQIFIFTSMIEKSLQ
jgi:hypothetical protein